MMWWYYVFSILAACSIACFPYNKCFALYRFAEEQYKSTHGCLPSWYMIPTVFARGAWFALSVAYQVGKSKVKTDSIYKQVVTPLDKHTAKITYEWNGKMYHIIQLVKSHHQVRFLSAEGVRHHVGTVVSVTEDKMEDVSEEIQQYLGPSEDWHEVELTPSKIGFKVIKITKLDPDTFDDETKTYETNDRLEAL